jgi:hypothetical protein
LVITGDTSFKPKSTIQLVKPRKIAAFAELSSFDSLDIDGPFLPMPSRKFVSLASLNADLPPEFADWGHADPIHGLVLKGRVVHGFGRGSKQLGVPTANVEMTDENKALCEGLIPGVYSATAFLHSKPYKCAMSIGWNPVYENTEKTIEAYLIDDSLGEFYGEWLELTVTGFIRAEALFGDFDSLIQAI